MTCHLYQAPVQGILKPIKQSRRTHIRSNSMLKLYQQGRPVSQRKGHSLWATEPPGTGTLSSNNCRIRRSHRNHRAHMEPNSNCPMHGPTLQHRHHLQVRTRARLHNSQVKDRVLL